MANDGPETRDSIDSYKEQVQVEENEPDFTLDTEKVELDELDMKSIEVNRMLESIVLNADYYREAGAEELIDEAFEQIKVLGALEASTEITDAEFEDALDDTLNLIEGMRTPYRARIEGPLWMKLQSKEARDAEFPNYFLKPVIDNIMAQNPENFDDAIDTILSNWVASKETYQAIMNFPKPLYQDAEIDFIKQHEIDPMFIAMISNIIEPITVDKVRDFKVKSFSLIQDKLLKREEDDLIAKAKEMGINPEELSAEKSISDSNQDDTIALNH